MDFSVRKSFKSLSSFDKHEAHEKLPILSDHRKQQQEAMSTASAPDSSSDRREFIVKIEDAGGKEAEMNTKNGGGIWRESSIEFWKDEKSNGGGGFEFKRSAAKIGEDDDDDEDVEEDPPSKLIGRFLHKQRASGDSSLDMDLEMDELRESATAPPQHDLPPLPESPRNSRASREIMVPFHRRHNDDEDSVRRRKDSSTEDDNRRRISNGGGDVIRCTSSFRRGASFNNNRSGLLRLKTRSRLMDPPPDDGPGRVPKSGLMRSGMLGRGGAEDEEDDPFLEEDLPDEYRRAKLNAVTMAQWLSLFLILAAVACTLSFRVLREKNLWKLKMWKWEVLILVSICGRLVSGWMIRFMVFFVERNFILRKRVLYFVYGIRKAVQNCIWLGLVLLGWHFLLIRKVEKETNMNILEYVTKVLLCLLIGGLIWLVKTLIVKVLASSFHVSSYFDRIQDALFNQYVIQTLSGQPWIEIHKEEDAGERLADDLRKLENAGATLPPDLKKNACPPSGNIGKPVGVGSGRSGGLIAKSGGLLGKSGNENKPISKKAEEAGITIGHLHRLNPKNVSAWNMKRLMNIVKNGHLTTLDEQILDSTKDEGDTQIRSEVEAKAAAKKIFCNVARPGSKYIYLEDLLRFMEEDVALKTMSLFEGATESKRISKSLLKNWVINCVRERRALALTLNDTKTAVNRLRRVVDVLVSIIILVIWLLVLGIVTSANIVYATSQLVIVAFIFGNSCKTVFEAVIFLFVMHPFDVGDRCEIEGVQMVVEEMNILTTVFLRYDNLKIVYPNSTLSTKPINNFYRSPDTGDAVEFCVHITTPADKIAAMKKRMISYIENKKEHWHPTPMIVLKEVEELNRMRFAIWLTHRMNFQDMGEKWARRALLLEEMVRIFQELDIQYRLLPIDINVRGMPPSTTALPSSNFQQPGAEWGGKQVIPIF